MWECTSLIKKKCVIYSQLDLKTTKAYIQSGKKCAHSFFFLNYFHYNKMKICTCIEVIHQKQQFKKENFQVNYIP